MCRSTGIVKTPEHYRDTAPNRQKEFMSNTMRRELAIQRPSFGTLKFGSISSMLKATEAIVTAIRFTYRRKGYRPY